MKEGSCYWVTGRYERGKESRSSWCRGGICCSPAVLRWAPLCRVPGSSLTTWSKMSCVKFFKILITCINSAWSQKQQLECFTWDLGVLLSWHIQWEVFQLHPDWAQTERATIKTREREKCPFFGKRNYLNKHSERDLTQIPESSPAAVNQELVPVRTVSDHSRQNPHSHIIQTARADHRLLHIWKQSHSSWKRSAENCRNWRSLQTVETSLHTIEGVVPRVHLTELCHVLHWVTAGRGGAYAWLTGDAKILQSVPIQNQEEYSLIGSEKNFETCWSMIHSMFKSLR